MISVIIITMDIDGSCQFDPMLKAAASQDMSARVESHG